MKKEIIYNKLVRDNILEIISCNNQKSSYHIATDEEYKNKLLEKLQEEISEFIIDKNEEELADIFEVIEHIITTFNFNKEKIFEIKEQKAEKNGNFRKKIILEKVFNIGNNN
ncbi:nucleoside triphosphate pyrophosphohydrolase [Fusobacterium polymorphum]|uniref:nucleoside triphosphate pyrophosphohydrolase n=1 Tax=Fusobacterium nucleatum subsp. polymorphum TaxID=76857 RepID=UPI00300956F9